MSDAAFAYAGSELELFSHAVHWKAYWAAVVRPFIGSRVLDVGAGIGSTAANLPSAECLRWIELEPDPALADRIRDAVANGRLPGTLQVITGTIHSLPAAPLFDTALYIDVLEHIEDDAAELREAAARLVPGGRIVILAPAHNALYTPFDRAIGHHRRYAKGMLRQIAPAGLDLECLRYIDSVGLLASLGNKLLLQSSQPKPSQISLWDNWMVPVSRRIDGLLFGQVGKSVLCVLKKPLGGG